MKLLKLFLAVVITLSYVHTQAQETPYLKVTYQGKVGNRYYVKIENKQSCQVDLQFQYLKNANAISIAPDPKNNVNYNQIISLGTQVYVITGDLNAISVKNLTICNWHGDPTWITISCNINALPLKFGTISIHTFKSSK